MLRGKEAKEFRKRAEANTHKLAPYDEVKAAVDTFCAVIKNSYVDVNKGRTKKSKRYV